MGNLAANSGSPLCRSKFGIAKLGIAKLPIGNDGRLIGGSVGRLIGGSVGMFSGGSVGTLIGWIVGVVVPLQAATTRAAATKTPETDGQFAH